MTPISPLIVSFGEPEWDVAFAPALEQLLEPTYTHPDVVLDMSGVEFIDSTCLGKLVKMRKERNQCGFDVERLIVPTKNIRHVFSIVRFDQIWPLYFDLSEAMSDPEPMQRHLRAV